ncbi:type II toxin-antitoxin system RelE/ParE family toxin [Dyadobacter sandarakinus]|uniref:Type II toxin-antitoxin system RelE/ParE family toxin n=1 Tax=Dyadobacter sandarakinus TaxID=2747268 RepID=A0ABX7IA02_9BACT|nr:type II toxin-antitoxin system RelE/ParE family toxin [Dyadobacter sandarakinus]QRR02745.1 type II toxin-antitoxin system RelE/ParE family toxin [Dyadobacter sandarakinus]
MAFKVKWTAIAKENYREALSYIYDEWGGQVAERFTEELEAKIEVLVKFPYLGRQHSSLPAVRQLVVRKKQVLFYTVVDADIIILNLLNTSRKR